MHRPKDVAEQLGISPATLRLWSTKFESLLSPGAQAAQTETGTPTQRKYTDADVLLFRRAQKLLKDGLTYEDVAARLPEEDEVLEEPPHVTSSSTTIALDGEHPVLLAFRQALAAKDETIATLRQRIADLEAQSPAPAVAPPVAFRWEWLGRLLVKDHGLSGTE